jgi:hypothetical protein
MSTLTRGPTVTIAVMECHDRSSSGPPRRPAVRRRACHAALRPEERCGDLWMEIDPEEVGGRSGDYRQSQLPFGFRTTTDTSTPGPSVSSDPSGGRRVSPLRQGRCCRGCMAAVPARSGSNRASGRRRRLGPSSTARVLLRIARSVRKPMRSTYSSSRLTCRYRSR